MNLDFANPSLYLDIAQSVAMVVLWLRKPGEDAGRVLTCLASRIDVLDEKVKHMPGVGELEVLKGDVKTVSAQLVGMQENVRTTRDAVVRIEDFLRVHR